LLRREPDPGSEVAAGAACLRWRGERLDGSGDERADTREAHEPTRRVILLGACGDLLVQCGDFLLQFSECRDEMDQAVPRRLRDA
jgi:hypothetical protein